MFTEDLRDAEPQGCVRLVPDADQIHDAGGARLQPGTLPRSLAQRRR